MQVGRQDEGRVLRGGRVGRVSRETVADRDLSPAPPAQGGAGGRWVIGVW